MNPFVVIGYRGNETFCDRENETRALIKNLKNGRNTCIISPRRLGKTALVYHVFANLKDWVCVYVDLNLCNNLDDFLKSLASSLANIPSAHKFSFLELLTSLKFSVEMDALTGQYSVGFNLVKPGDNKKSVSELLKIIARQKNVVIALDEFQQILSFKEAQVEGWLRAEAQQHSSVRFIYSGSQQRVLHEMFGSNKRPFYHSAELMTLTCIPKDVYTAFIVDQFKKGKKSISKDVAGFIYDYCLGFTAYIQLVCNHLYDDTLRIIKEDSVLTTVGELLKQYEPFYLKLKKPLTDMQFKVLYAVAKLKKVYAITGNEFMSAAGITNPSSASKAVAALLKYDLIYTDTDESGKEFYSIDDVLFLRWLERQSI
ncbi:MAG: ATP-binding protein [Cyclobacteriaceae bacterium]|nr:ATP-binding protein [Cyclobacteriaceae bacterium]